MGEVCTIYINDLMHHQLNLPIFFPKKRCTLYCASYNSHLNGKHSFCSSVSPIHFVGSLQNLLEHCSSKEQQLSKTVLNTTFEAVIFQNACQGISEATSKHVEMKKNRFYLPQRVSKQFIIYFPSSPYTKHLMR